VQSAQIAPQPTVLVYAVVVQKKMYAVSVMVLVPLKIMIVMVIAYLG
jgi:hypothetical protein